MCEELAVHYDGNETLKDNTTNLLGIYIYVGDKLGTKRPVFVLSNSTSNSLIWNAGGIGWLGAVDIMHS